MKTKLLQTVFVLCMALLTKAQTLNLVPNGDFELGPDSSAEGWSLWWDSTCNNPVPVKGPDFWTSVSGSPDRLLEDDIFIGCHYDIDTAQSGRAWINFVYAESAKTNLLLPIEKDSAYILSYYFKYESFNGLATQPSYLIFKFNNGIDSMVSPLVTNSNNWQYSDTVFIALQMPPN